MGNYYSHNTIIPNTLEFEPLIWPKKEEKWNELIKIVIQFLNIFEDLETPQKTIIELNIQLYNVCQNHLSKKNTTYYLPQRFKQRENLIQSIYSKKYSPRPTCTNEELADRFKTLNYGKKKVTFSDNYIVNPNWKEFDCSKFKYKDFKELLDTKRNNKSNFDGLCYELVRRTPLLKMKLLRLFNEIFKSTELPDKWYYGIVYGLYKGSGEINNALNFRPLVRMDTFSKLYWHLIVHRLNSHIQKHNIINTDIQKAFQVDTSGVVQSLFIHQVVKPDSNVVVYLDIKNAFGSLQSSFVKLVLEIYGVPEFIVNSIITYLENRTVWIGTEQRTWNSGVPQGSVLSNLLFILCMNYILTQIHDKYYTKFGVSVHNCKFLLQAFADDIVIYGQSVECVQIILDDLYTLLKCACLDLQVKKCIVDYNNNDTKKKVYLNNIEIPDITTKPNFKYLGQYASITNIWERFTSELKLSLNKIKELYIEKLENPNAKDYWYAYQVMWKYRINWFITVFDCTIEKSNMISDIEKEWFSQINGLENRLTDNDYKKRQENSLISRHKTLDYSLDPRVSIVYRKSMGDRYKEVSKLHQDNPNISSNTGFKKKFYNIDN